MGFIDADKATCVAELIDQGFAQEPGSPVWTRGEAMALPRPTVDHSTRSQPGRWFVITSGARDHQPHGTPDVMVCSCTIEEFGKAVLQANAGFPIDPNPMCEMCGHPYPLGESPGAKATREGTTSSYWEWIELYCYSCGAAFTPEQTAEIRAAQ